jgi:hypothetical protein
MPESKIEIVGASIVLVGSLNPAIFQPQWFARNGLLPQKEVDEADLQVVHPQMSHFETERFVLQVTPERFNGFSKQNTISAPLKDLVLGTFFILEHTPVTAMGINAMFHFSIPSEESWHRIGDKLAPKEAWKEVLPGRPGMLSLDIISPKESPKGASIRVRIQPSVLVKPHGVYFEINNHFPASEESGLKGLMSLLQSEWDSAQENGETIARYILNWAAAN